MQRWWLAFILCAIAVSASGIDAESFDDPVLQSRYQYLTHVLRCPKCQNESIAESNAPVAVDLRREVRRMLQEGRTDQEILDFMSSRFGDFVLFKPPVTTRTWLLWSLPAMVLAIALGSAIVVIRRRAQLPAGPDSEEEASIQ